VAMFVSERTVRTMASAWLASTAAVPGTVLLFPRHLQAVYAFRVTCTLRRVEYFPN